jgi:membrane protein implicated in regulation of membrane protease activity
MNEWLTQYLAETIVAIGLLLLTVEVVILGFATFILFFMGLAMVLTGTALWLEVLPHSYNSVLMSTALLTAILAFSLWKPLKRMQGDTESKVVDSDFVGVCFIAEQAISLRENPDYKFSGIMWKLKSEQEIEANTEVKIIKAEVGTLWVKPVTKHNVVC